MKTQVPFYLMVVSEIARTGKRIQEIAQKIVIETFTQTGLLANLESKNDKMDQAQSRLSTKEQTRLMRQFDKGRDNGSKAIKHLAQAAAYRKAEEKQEAARLIISLYKEKGWNIEKLGLAEQTEVVDSIIHTIDTNITYKNAISVINAEGAYAEMKEEQVGYKQSNMARTEQKASTELAPNEVAKEVEEACEKLIRYVEVMADVTPDEKYTRFLEELNVIIVEATAAIKLRQSSNKEEEINEEA